MTRTIAVLLLLGTLLPSCSKPTATTAPVDATPAPAAATSEPAASAAAPEEPAADAVEAPAATGAALALRHPGQARTRSAGEITGPAKPEVPAAGRLGSPCADRRPGESWESDGSTCHCNPAGQIRCSRQTELGKQLRGAGE